MSLESIKAAIPHREPFLLLDEIVEQTDRRIVCRKTFTDNEFWYQGHYPSFPLTPGVLLCEAGMQAGAVLLSKFSAESSGGVPVVTRLNNAKFRNMVRPGDTIEIAAELNDRLADAFFLRAKITANDKTAATFDFVCKLAQPL